MTLATINPVGAGGYDSFIHQNAKTSNYGTNNYMSVGLSGSILRGILKFDLSVIPSSAVVNAATVSLYCDTYNLTRDVILYQCLRPWVEGSVNWNTYDGTNNWTTAGADSDGNDYVSTNLGSVTVSSTGAKTIPIQAAGVTVIQNWVNTSVANNGFILRHSLETADNNRYSSSDCGTAAQVPKIIVDYTDSGAGAAGYTLILNT
jgi:hypothetical protein